MGAFTASGSLVIGSNAFTSAEVERNVDIDVVGDPGAFLGLRYPNGDSQYPEGDPNATPPETLSADGTTNLFKATNQFAADIDTFSVTILTGDEAFDDVDINENEPDDFGPGAHASVTIDVDCVEDTTAEVVVEISAGGTGFSVSAERAFTVECQAPSNGNVNTSIAQFNGSGKFVFNGDESLDGKELRAWYHDGGAISRTDTATANLSGDGSSINLNQLFDTQKSIIALEFEGEDRYFIRDTWDSNSCTFDGSATSATEKTGAELCNELDNCTSTPAICSN